MNNPSAERKLIMILLSDEEWDILELKDAFGSGTTTRDNVISKVHEIFDQVHFVCVRIASNHFAIFYRVVQTTIRCPY